MDQDKRPPTLKTIALLSGYSVTAVSRALKDGHDISQNTKEKVRAIAKEVGYRPSTAGLRLRTGKTQTISLILDVDDKVMGITSQLVNGLSKRLQGTGYNLVVTPCSYTDGRNTIEAVKHVVETASADAVILTRTQPDDKRVEYLTENHMPFACHGRSDDSIQHAWADYDNKRFAYEAMGRLAARGAKKVCMIGPPSDLTFASHVSAGAEDGAREYGLSLKPWSGITIDDPMDKIEAGIFHLMSSNDRPDGLLSVSGSATMAAVAGLERSGLKLGSDVHFVSKESVPILRWYRPEIETFFENVTSSGYVLGDFALRLLAGECPSTLTHLDF